MNEEKLNEKIEFLDKINNDDVRFVVNVLKSYKKKQERFESKKQNSNIILKENAHIDKINNVSKENEHSDRVNNNSKENEHFDNINDISKKNENLNKDKTNNNLQENANLESSTDIIDLDSLYAKPYFYTEMRIKLNYIVEQVTNTDIETIKQNPVKFCNQISLKKVEKINKPNESNKNEEKLDIVEFINKYQGNAKNLKFIAKEIDEETIFKQEELLKAIKAKNINNIQERNSYIYDEIIKYLDEDFISNNYCDFKNDKCVKQRRLHLYPPQSKDGCCFMKIRKCNHLNNGRCTINCLPCRLFACSYLGERGIGYRAYEFILLKAFFTKKQRKHFVFDFFTDKDEILKHI